MTRHRLRRRSARRAAEPAGHARARRPRRARATGSPATGVPRIEAASFVSPKRVPQMAGAEEVVAASTARDGVVYAGLVAQRARLRPAVATRRSTRCTSRSRRSEEFNQRNQSTSRRGGRWPTPSGSSTRAAADGIRATRHDRRRRSAARSRAPSTPARVRSSPSGSPRRARTRSCSPTRSASACRARCATSSAACARLGVPVGVHLHNTRNTGLRERATPRSRRARRVFDASIGGHRRLPVRAARDRATSRPRISSICSHGEGVETGIDLDALIAVAQWLEARSGASSRVRSTRPGHSRRSPARERKTSMAYRLGVDVGGTFTDLFLVSEGNGGAQFRVKTPSTPDDPSEGVLDRRPPDLRRGRHRRRRAAEHPPRHDRRDERGARVEGRARRPDHDRRASARSSTSPARRRRGRSQAGSS